MKNIAKKQNLAFRKANKARKRVMIAKDVLRQLDAKQLDVDMAPYCSIVFPKIKTTNLQKLLTKTDECSVCAIGAVFCSTVLYRNKFEINKHNSAFDDNGKEMYFSSDRESIKDYLIDLFDEEQCKILEYLFEGWCCYDKLNIPADHLAYKYNLYNKSDRLRFLMNNIIKNKGTLIIEGING